MYQVNANILTYNASDSSGVFVFVPITGNTLRLHYHFLAFVEQYRQGSYFSEEQMCAALPDYSLDDIQQSIKHLLTEHIIDKVESLEA
ncbi:hypothetical protein FX988_01492 [Paraglaciecola mesophila]|uniref:Uncharacterized protein n=1 Tax=Paraglaciecola mesophila TaxID=197222 RepID=A0A857JKV2_9ALTE|nr:hypothetical protein [Paraglaciecola mesophila]QHJ11264.1 hypothetical protein FX988_01492 [Paraglaciecola mesophila]